VTEGLDLPETGVRSIVVGFRPSIGRFWAEALSFQLGQDRMPGVRSMNPLADGLIRNHLVRFMAAAERGLVDGRNLLSGLTLMKRRIAEENDAAAGRTRLLFLYDKHLVGSEFYPPQGDRAVATLELAWILTFRTDPTVFFVDYGEIAPGIDVGDLFSLTEIRHRLAGRGADETMIRGAQAYYLALRADYDEAELFEAARSIFGAGRVARITCPAHDFFWRETAAALRDGVAAALEEIGDGATAPLLDTIDARAAELVGRWTDERRQSLEATVRDHL
jgi:hypothetical protein